MSGEHRMKECPGCRSRNTEWKSGIHDTGTVEAGMIAAKMGRRCKDCGEEYTVGVVLDLDTGEVKYDME